GHVGTRVVEAAHWRIAHRRRQDRSAGLLPAGDAGASVRLPATRVRRQPSQAAHGDAARAATAGTARAAAIRGTQELLRNAGWAEPGSAGRSATMRAQVGVGLPSMKLTSAQPTRSM